MEKTILITDENHRFFGQRFPAECIYYDSSRRGDDSSDLFKYELPNGATGRVLSKQIDKEDWEAQCLAEAKELLGVEIGHMVMITKIGSGFYVENFDTNQPHIVTNIFSDGRVEFDNGAAQIFRPTVEKYAGTLYVQTDFSKMTGPSLTDII